MKSYIIIIISMLMSISSWAQDRKPQNRPYTDLRYFHFGIQVGAHLQDMELMNMGPITVTDEEGNTQEAFITADQDRFDPGFNVGVLGEFRLSENFQFRIAPAIYFGSRHITFVNHTTSTEDHQDEVRQDLKSAYITSAFDLIFAAPRCNNHRAYLMAGLTPTLNLTGRATDYLRLKGFQTFLEFGVGMDEYLPYFKCRPELKFMFGLGNALDMGHPDELRDKTMIQYARSIGEAHTKMVTLTFYFE